MSEVSRRGRRPDGRGHLQPLRQGLRINGLALAREIAEAHGGRISLGNRPEGGLVVAMVLPIPDDRSL